MSNMLHGIIIEMENVFFGYGRHAVLDNISVQIQKGQRWAIIGRNGAGKSTLIRCLAGLEKPLSGNVIINGKKIQNYNPRQLAGLVTYVPQVQGRAVPYSVRDYIMMGRYSYQGFLAIPSKGDIDVVNQSMKLTDTESLADRQMNTLSGGEIQRVFLAGAVSQQAEIMLLDEPATFLDPLHQEMMYTAIDRIHQNYNTTILTVTHDINNAIARNNNVLAIAEKSVYYAGPCLGIAGNNRAGLKDIFGLDFMEGTIPATGSRFLFPAGLA